MLTSIEPEAEKIGTCDDCAGYFDAGKDTCKTCHFDLNSYNKPEEEEETDDEDEPECCGKHCDETKGLKKAMCFNRYYENETDMVTEQLVCDKCFDDLTTSYCYSCTETYHYTELEHKKGGRWGGGDFYCKSCVVSISSKNYNPDEYV